MSSTFLSPKSLAVALGVSESSVKRWADEGKIEAVRTEGGHRRIARREALRYIRANGLTIHSPGAIGLEVIEHATGDPGDDALTRAIVDGDEERAQGILLGRYLAGENAAALCDGPVAASLRRVGELWRHGVKGIYQEHRATEACLQALTVLRSALPRPCDEAPVAIGCAPPEDPYRIPSLMASLVLAAAGWREHNLGANLPTRALMAAMNAWQPRLVWLSFCSKNAAEKFTANAPALIDLARQKGITLVAGGQACPASFRKESSPVHYLGSMEALDAFARALNLERSGDSQRVTSPARRHGQRDLPG